MCIDNPRIYFYSQAGTGSPGGLVARPSLQADGAKFQTKPRKNRDIDGETSHYGYLNVYSDTIVKLQQNVTKLPKSCCTKWK